MDEPVAKVAAAKSEPPPARVAVVTDDQMNAVTDALMAKDDSALTPRELTAVAFARKITREPAKLSKEDYAALVSEFKDQGALEVLLQSCNFAYMNRFTDGLRLPSEDEAIKTYQETYGGSFEERRRSRKQAAG